MPPAEGEQSRGAEWREKLERERENERERETAARAGGHACVRADARVREGNGYHEIIGSYL